MQEKDNKYIDLYDENMQMHEDMLELQEQLEEAGFLDDALSESGLEEDGGSGGKGSKIPGKKNAKKVIKTLGKLLKRKKGKEKKKKSKEKEVEEDEEVEDMPPVEKVTIEQPIKVEEPIPEENNGPSPRQEKEKKSEKAPKKKKEQVPQPFESDVKEYIKQIEDLQTKVKEATAKIKQLDKDCSYKDEEVTHWKKIAEDLSEKVQFYEHRESELKNQEDVHIMEINELNQQC